MPSARAPTPIFRNWPSNVPTFSNMLAAPARPGMAIPIRHRATMIFFTVSSFSPCPSADDDELAALRSLTRLDHEDIDPADDVLPVARDQIPSRLTVVGIVLLLVVSRS